MRTKKMQKPAAGKGRNEIGALDFALTTVRASASLTFGVQHLIKQTHFFFWESDLAFVSECIDAI